MAKNYYWDENKGLFRASIERGGRSHNIGTFKEEIDAQIAVAFWKSNHHQNQADRHYAEYEKLLAIKEEQEEIAREREAVLDSLEEYERDDL